MGRVEGLEGEELVRVQPQPDAPAITALTGQFCCLRPVWFWSSTGIQRYRASHSVTLVFGCGCMRQESQNVIGLRLKHNLRRCHHVGSVQVGTPGLGCWSPSLHSPALMGQPEMTVRWLLECHPARGREVTAQSFFQQASQAATRHSLPLTGQNSVTGSHLDWAATNPVELG